MDTIRTCPFCNYNEAWSKTDSEGNYKVKCTVCGAEGPSAKSYEMATKKWNGFLAELSDQDDQQEFNDALNEFINPYDKIGDMMAKRMKVPLLFKQGGKHDEEIHQIDVDKSTRGKELEPDEFAKKIKEELVNDDLNEDAVGGVSTPMATLANTPGMGSAVPAKGNMTTKGSGDTWGAVNKKPYTQTKKEKTEKKKGKGKKKYRIATYGEYVNKIIK